MEDAAVSKLDDSALIDVLLAWCRLHGLDAVGDWGLLPHTFDNGVRGIQALEAGSSHSTLYNCTGDPQMTDMYQKMGFAPSLSDGTNEFPGASSGFHARGLYVMGGSKHKAKKDRKDKKDKSEKKKNSTSTAPAEPAQQETPESASASQDASRLILQVPHMLMFTATLALTANPCLAALARIAALLQQPLREKAVLALAVLEHRRFLDEAHGQRLRDALADPSVLNWLPYTAVLPPTYDTTACWSPAQRALLGISPRVSEAEAAALEAPSRHASDEWRELTLALKAANRVITAPESARVSVPAAVAAAASQLRVLARAPTLAEYAWASAVIGTRSVFTPPHRQGAAICEAHASTLFSGSAAAPANLRFLSTMYPALSGDSVPAVARHVFAPGVIVLVARDRTVSEDADVEMLARAGTGSPEASEPCDADVDAVVSAALPVAPGDRPLMAPRSCALVPFFDLLNHSDEAVCSIRWQDRHHHHLPNTARNSLVSTAASKTAAEAPSPEPATATPEGDASPAAPENPYPVSTEAQPAYLLSLDAGSVFPAPGGEVFISYGLLSNAELLTRYGFLIPGNRHDFVPVSRAWVDRALADCFYTPAAPAARPVVRPPGRGPRGPVARPPVRPSGARPSAPAAPVAKPSGPAAAPGPLPAVHQELLSRAGLYNLSARHAFKLSAQGLPWDLEVYLKTRILSPRFIHTWYARARGAPPPAATNAATDALPEAEVLQAVADELLAETCLDDVHARVLRHCARALACAAAVEFGYSTVDEVLDCPEEAADAAVGAAVCRVLEEGPAATEFHALPPYWQYLCRALRAGRLAILRATVTHIKPFAPSEHS